MATSKKLVGETYEFYYDNRGFYYLRLLDGEGFEMSHVSEIQNHISDNLSGEVRPFLIELGYGSTIGDDVQEHIIHADNRFSSADAVLISTYAHKLITEFFIRKYKPMTPIRIFTDIFAALAWIKTMNGDKP